MSGDPDREIPVGVVAGAYGVRGWLKIRSFTDPRDNVVRYPQWILRQGGISREVAVSEGRAHGNTVIAKLDGIDDRDSASGLIGAEIAVRRVDLPACEPGEYYWADLEGLRVLDRDGRELGRVVRLIETGAHDVLVLDEDGKRLVPFVLDEVVESVDLQHGVLTVNWDESFWDE